MDEHNGRLQIAVGSDVVELAASSYVHPTVGAGTFPTVDEIQAALVAFADRPGGRLSVIGSSPAGEPLRVLSVGRGEIAVLVIGGVHATSRSATTPRSRSRSRSPGWCGIRPCSRARSRFTSSRAGTPTRRDATAGTRGG
jgi:hypothetical protein